MGGGPGRTSECPPRAGQVALPDLGARAGVPPCLPRPERCSARSWQHETGLANSTVSSHAQEARGTRGKGRDEPPHWKPRPCLRPARRQLPCAEQWRDRGPAQQSSRCCRCRPHGARRTTPRGSAMRAAGTAAASARRSRGNAVLPGSARSVLRWRRVFGQVDWDRRRRRHTRAPIAASRRRVARGKAAPLGRRARRGRGTERVGVAIKRRSKTATRQTPVSRPPAPGL